jgi:hypothetical protein
MLAFQSIELAAIFEGIAAFGVFGDVGGCSWKGTSIVADRQDLSRNGHERSFISTGRESIIVTTIARWPSVTFTSRPTFT